MNIINHKAHLLGRHFDGDGFDDFDDLHRAIIFSFLVPLHFLWCFRGSFFRGVDFLTIL